MFFHKTLSVAALGALLAAPVSVHAQAPVEDLRAQAAQLIDGTDVPGVAVMLLKDAAVTSSGSAGVRDVTSRVPVEGNDVWHLGSNSKAIAATVIARLVENGTLSWDTPLEAMLPDLAADMDAAYRPATLEDLLSHRAGLIDHLGMDAVLAAFADARPVSEQRLAWVKQALALSPVATPRTDSTYSNTGYVLAAVIAERATGKTFETLTRELVLDPLGMSSAVYGGTVPGQPLGHKAGSPVSGYLADNPPVLAPAGELHMSLEDWSRFVIDQMKGERGEGVLLGRDSYVRLHAAQGETRSALGWGTSPSLRGKPGRYLTHMGSNGYWRALVVLRLDNDSGMLLAMNCSDGCEADTVMGRALEAFVPRINAD